MARPHPGGGQIRRSSATASITSYPWICEKFSQGYATSFTFICLLLLLSCRSRAEAFAIFLRSHRELLKKCATQRLFVPESGDPGDPFYWEFACL
jgi:hypothetical protein